MRGVLLLALALAAASAAPPLAQPNQPCSPDTDLLLMENPAVSPAAFLRCLPTGIP